MKLLIIYKGKDIFKSKFKPGLRIYLLLLLSLSTEKMKASEKVNKEKDPRCSKQGSNMHDTLRDFPR